MGKTVSEVLFEEFCRILGVRFERIPPGKGQTPDYDIFPNGYRVVVEIKQIDPNDDDVRADKELRSGKGTLIPASPGKRVRKKITDAAPQLKERAKGFCPSLLVLYNNVFPANYTDPNTIKTGMYGLEQVVLTVPQDFSVPVTVRDKKFGPKRRMTPQYNTSISGVAVMIADGGRPKELRVYHNIYAAMPLSPDLLRSDMVRHFTLEEKQPRKLQEWVQIA